MNHDLAAVPVGTGSLGEEAEKYGFTQKNMYDLAHTILRNPQGAAICLSILDALVEGAKFAYAHIKEAV